MPKVMRCVSRLVLFVLVIVVSGVGTAQAQTDPDSVPPRPDQERSHNSVSKSPGPTRVTPDLVAKSARLYGTDEQIIRTSDDGGSGASGDANYWFSLSWSSGHDEVIDNTVWYFYKIDGYEAFFVEVVGTAGAREVNQSIDRYEPYIDTQYSNATEINLTPRLSVPLNTDVLPFEVSYEPVEGVKGSVKTQIPYAEAYLNPSVQSDWYSVELKVRTGVNLLHRNRAYANRSVSVWNGEPWGIYIGACGQYLEWAQVQPPVAVPHDWGEPRRYACEYGGT